MNDIASLFLRGVRDSLMLRQGLEDVLASAELTKRTIQITLINGGLYFGSVWLFEGLLYYLSPTASESVAGNFPTGLAGVLWTVTGWLAWLVLGLVYQAWVFSMYIVAMTLTTFWA